MNSLLIAYSDSDSDGEVHGKGVSVSSKVGSNSTGTEAGRLTDQVPSTSADPPGRQTPFIERAKPLRLPDAADLLGTSSRPHVLPNQPRLPVAFASSDSIRPPLVGASNSAVAAHKRPGFEGACQREMKVPKFGDLPAARGTLGSTLMPPQLRGRSNVSTEDLEKMFVKRGKKA